MSEVKNALQIAGVRKGNKATADNKRAEARWSRAVLGHGFTLIPALLINNQDKIGLTPEQFNTLIQLAYHWRNSEEDPYPTKKRLGRLMGKSEKQVQRYLKELEDMGLLDRVMRFRSGRGQTSSGYDLSKLVKRLREIGSEVGADRD